MRSTGGRHVSLFLTVGRFDRFLSRAYPKATTITKEILLAWFSSFDHLRPASRSRYRSATFQLCKFLRCRDPRAATREDIPPLRIPSDFHPYIFSPEQIARLLRAARELDVLRSDPLRPWSMELVLVLLYTAGLRIGEVMRLEVRDYDAAAATLIIRETKFAKTRLVALSTSAKKVLDAYLVRRRKLRLRCEPTDPLRCSPANRAPCVGGTQAGLTSLMRRCGMKPARGRCGPRVHDVRHTFAVHRVLDWYCQGQDVQALLPRLVTYMGHRGLESTQRYLALTPAVLREAGTRFETFAGIDVPARQVQP
jgi:integrase/recombinase XerD